MKWKQLEKKEKGKLIIKIAAWTLAAALVVLTLLASEDSIFGHIFSDSGSSFEAIGNWINHQVPMIIKAVVYIIIIYLISKLLRYIVSKLILTSKRGKTTAKLIDSFIRYLTALIIIIAILIVFGVDPVALFASIGILGLIIGLGAQSLISDIISGLFIVFEGEFEVGDYIVIDGFRGKVESIGIRTTQFVDYGGNIKIINNSEIKTVVNLSYADSLLAIDVKIKHHHFKKAEEVIHANIDKIREALPNFTYGPNYVGVSDFADEGIQLKFAGKVQEDIRFQSERDLRRQIKLLFDEHNIDIALPKFYVENVEK